VGELVPRPDTTETTDRTDRRFFCRLCRCPPTLVGKMNPLGRWFILRGGRFGVFSVRFLVWIEQTGKSGFVRGGVIREVGKCVR